MKRTCITTAALLLALALPALAEPMKGDGPGCKDKALGARLATLTEADPDYIAIWATGMADQSCRGYSAGVEVTVEERGDGIACVRAAEDAACFWVRAEIAP